MIFSSFPSWGLGTRKNLVQVSGLEPFPRSQALAWERICARSPGFGPSPVTGSWGFPGKQGQKIFCPYKLGLGNEKKRFAKSFYSKTALQAVLFLSEQCEKTICKIVLQ